MTDWIEYMTSEDDVEMARLRRQNGRDKAWKVRFLGIGNESWGCGGEMTPEYYSDILKQYSNYAWQYAHEKTTRVGCGSNGEDYNWTKVLMQNAARQMDALSLHYYTIAGPGWGNKTAATGFGEDLYFSGLRKALHIQDLVRKHSLIMDEYDRRKRVGLFVDEWGIWTDVEPGTNPGFLFQQNSIRDALIASTTLDIFNHNADRVRMANIAQTVNVLQAMILTQGSKMVLTPTYHVFNMYKVHANAKLLSASLISEKYTYGNESIPAISQTASIDDNGKIHLTISNLNPNSDIKLPVEILGMNVSKVNSANVLTAPQFNSVNTFDKPETVKPVGFKAYKMVSANLLEITLPSKSILVMELE